MEAGDLILWDSRTVHGGRVGDGEEPDRILADLRQQFVDGTLTHEEYMAQAQPFTSHTVASAFVLHPISSYRMHTLTPII